LEEHTVSPDEINKLLTAKPFEPFRLYLTDGRTFDIHHPDFVLVGNRAVHVYEYDDPESRRYSNYAVVGILHIVRAEPLATAAPPKR
jgi:hypothetical protein